LEVNVFRRLFIVVALVAALAACAAPGASPSPLATQLKVGLGYLQSVQFAQFYRAQEQGYYRDAGLDVTFQNEIAPNLITLVGQGAVDIGVADGTDVISAVGQGIPIVYAATIYALFPNVVMAPADSGISTPADLRGHSLGIPGRYGSSWVMLQAMLDSAGLTPDDIDIHDYPDYGQGVGLQQGQVDTATGFRNNEPVQLATQGFQTNLLTVDEITPLPGPGLIVSDEIVIGIDRTGTVKQAQKADAIRSFIAATLRAMGEIKANPELGLDDTFAVAPDLAANRDLQRAILDATIQTWDSAYTQEHGAGAIDADAWQESLDFMRGLPDSNIPADLTVDKLVTDDLLP
jgi:NitT/TauT family transport system substrate-binding protein